MFKVGDLVKVVCTSYYIDGLEDREWFDQTEVGKIGIVVKRDEQPENTLYLLSVIEEDGIIEVTKGKYTQEISLAKSAEDCSVFDFGGVRDASKETYDQSKKDE